MTYTVKDNLAYMLKNWVKSDSKGLVYFLIRIPALIFQPIIVAYIPKSMIDCINNGATVRKLILTVALLSIGVVLTTWLSPFLQELLLGSARIIRMRYAVSAFEKNMTADYNILESLEGREKNSRAMDFYRSYYSPAADFIETLNQFIVCILGVITSCALIYKINVLMILIILLSCAAEFLILKVLNKKDLETNKALGKLMVKFNYLSAVAKDASAAKDIRLYGFADYFIMTAAKRLNEYEKINSKYMGFSLKTGVLRAFLNLIRQLCAYGYLTYLVISGKLGVSDFIFYFGIITGFSNWISNAVYCYSNLERCSNSCSEYRSFVESENKAEGKTRAQFRNITSLEFKSVSFKYPQTEKDVIKNMSFKINAGEKIAVVGENGAGKTTAIKLLCGLYYPTDGEILINGKSSREFSKESYFDLFSAVFQDYYFLPVTIAQNISAAFECDRKKLFAALEKAGIMDKINTLEQKENSLMVKDVHKNAVDFSGGEKQKLLLAKAIYKDAPVLILDEPTAALDPISENELYLKYNEMTKNKISFFISHRLSSTNFCDRILFIKDGTITESGTHDELMALGGDYARMYNIQSYYYKTGEKAI